MLNNSTSHRKQRRIALRLLLGVLLWLTAHKAGAVIIFLKGQDQPVRGYLLRQNERVVVIDQLLPDDTTKERTISRSDIDDMIQTVSAERLEALRPDAPDKYREYAEELAEKGKDPDARVAAIRLFLIAADLAPDRLGRSCLLGMVPLARNVNEQRRFRAMAYLLDPKHNPNLLRIPLPTATPKHTADPHQAEFMLRALRLLRQGKGREALVQARRIKMKERLPSLTDTITFAEFERACAPTCPYCKRGRVTCPECNGKKFVLEKSCATCRARGDIACPHCGGDYRNNRLPPSLLKRIVRLELQWLPAAEPLADAPRPTRTSWSLSVQRNQSAPLPPLTLETVTEFDPRENVFQDGKWTSQ